MKIFLTGASSSPGFKTLLELSARGYRVYAIYNTHPIIMDIPNVTPIKLNLTYYERVVKLFNEVRPDVIIHMAAVGDVNLCEKNKELAWRINVDVTRLLVKLANKYNSTFLCLSTDYVFDGEKGNYKEEDVPNPINFYGLTKLIAEEIVRNGVNRHIVVRTSAIYGLGMGRKNFGKFLIEALSTGHKVKAIVDQWLSPTLNTLLARALIELLEKGIYGLYHVAGERVSRYEFAIRLAKRFGFNTDLIEPARMSDFNWVARRPRDSSLDSSRAGGIVSVNFNSLDYSLDLLYQEWISKRVK